MRKTRNRYKNGKHLSDLDMGIDHEKTTYEMVMRLTDICYQAGSWRFKKEFMALFGFRGLRSNGAYSGVNPSPRVALTHDVMNANEPRVYRETIGANKIIRIGQFYGHPEYMRRAVIAHNLVHALLDTPYITLKRGYKVTDKSKLHGIQWQKLYRMLREEFVNPYVELIEFDWREDKKEREGLISGGSPFEFNVHENNQFNVKIAKAKFGIKGNNKLTCCDCGEEYIPERCIHGEPHMNDDGRCMECHVEMNHGGSPMPDENINQCGNQTGYPEEDAKHFPGIPFDRWYY